MTGIPIKCPSPVGRRFERKPKAIALPAIALALAVAGRHLRAVVMKL